MAATVIDLLEAVHGQHQQRDRMVVTPGSTKLMLGHLEQRAPGPGPGQVIAVGAVIRFGQQPVMHHHHIAMAANAFP